VFVIIIIIIIIINIIVSSTSLRWSLTTVLVFEFYTPLLGHLGRGISHL
jgi:hypothetical protein